MTGEAASAASLPPLTYATFDTPVGALAVVTDPRARGDQPAGPSGAVVASGFGSLEDLLIEVLHAYPERGAQPADLPEVAQAIGDYFSGDVAALDRVSVAQSGPEFRREVWQAMRAIPAGQVYSYAELAAAAGRPRASRAAGTACATNPVAPFVPCHRVVRAGGALGAYGYGVEVKAALLKHEGYLSE
ncbi:MAG: methylated-DNA-[protein]-cysteine S-methyltransferase [Actinomycetota bacterium]|nr:methylated-DNA-[protein]-cysteine S-methyltransferase [Actinomycetota bacterium]